MVHYDNNNMNMEWKDALQKLKEIYSMIYMYSEPESVHEKEYSQYKTGITLNQTLV